MHENILRTTASLSIHIEGDNSVNPPLLLWSNEAPFALSDFITPKPCKFPLLTTTSHLEAHLPATLCQRPELDATNNTSDHDLRSRIVPTPHPKSYRASALTNSPRILAPRSRSNGELKQFLAPLDPLLSALKRGIAVTFSPTRLPIPSIQRQL